MMSSSMSVEITRRVRRFSCAMAAELPRAPQGYFVDQQGRHVQPRALFAKGSLCTAEDVNEGETLWEELCEFVFGSFDPNKPHPPMSTSPSLESLLGSCPLVLAKTILSKSSNLADTPTHSLDRWLDGFDLLQRLLSARILQQCEQPALCVGHLPVPPHPAPLLGICSLPPRALDHWASTGGEDVALPIGVSSMMMKGMDAAVQRFHPGKSTGATARDAGFAMFCAQRRRLLLCRGTNGESSGSNSQTPWSAFGIFPFAGSATQVKLRDAANCAIELSLDDHTFALKLRCVATTPLPRGMPIRLFAPRNGVLDEDGCVPPDALQPGSMLHALRRHLLNDTKPWRSEVSSKLAVIDEKLQSMLKR